jgi:hypothetical protein
MAAALPSKDSLTVARALGAHATLASLLARVRESEARLAAVRALIAPELAATVRAGPLDDKRWLLLVDHASAAAKLRQCLPRIEAALREQGFTGPEVRVKVRPRG